MRIFQTPAELAGAVGEHLGYSEWLLVDQDRVTAFAEVTGDPQWIHVDPDRAARGPFGTTIAHGYLMLSLLPALASEIYRVDGVGMAVNYGLDRVRFPAPLLTGSLVRAGIQVVTVTDFGAGVQVHARTTLEVQDAAKPCCVADTVTRFYT